MLSSKCKGNLSLAAPRTILFGATFSFIFNLISGIPFKPKIGKHHHQELQILQYSGISFSKFLTSDKESNK
jgi:hypothetical protein